MAFLNASLRRCGSDHWKKLPLLWFVASALLFSSKLDLPAQTTPFKEYQIKAAFLYHFTQFVEWPTNAFPEATTPLTIGILGSDPFGNALEDIVRGEKVNGHPLAIKRFRHLEEINACHILFISHSEGAREDEILGSLKKRSVLTVGETEGFAKNGGMVRFVTEKNKIRLRINADAAREANVTLSAKLLKLAEIVTTGKE